MGLEQRQHARHGGQHGDALAVDQLDEPRSGEAALKVQFGGKDGWHPEAHGLAEDVAQRQRVQYAQRMDEALVAHVGLGAVFDGPYAGQHVAVRDDDAFGVAGGAGGKENLERGLVRQAGDGAHLRGGKLAEPILECERGNGGSGVRCSQFSQQERIADGEPGTDVGGYARGKIGGSGGVEGNGQHSAQQAAVKGGDPLGAVLGPQQHAVACADALPGQKRGKTAGEARQFSIRGDAAPVALVAHHGNLAVEAAKIIDQCSQMIAHRCSARIMVRDEAAICGFTASPTEAEKAGQWP